MPNTLKNFLNNLSEVMHVLIDEQVVLRAGTLKFTPIVVHSSVNSRPTKPLRESTYSSYTYMVCVK